MKISDAKPGDVLRDKDGDVWIVSKTRAAAVQMSRNPPQFGHIALPVPNFIERDYGPFVRLVSEKEPTDAA